MQKIDSRQTSALIIARQDLLPPCVCCQDNIEAGDSKSVVQSGFTLIELLVASAIIVILAGLAIQAYVIYRAQAYQGIAQQMMGQARTAMEAGKVDSESFSGNLFFTGITPGPATAGDGSTIVPGLTLPDDFYVYVFHNPACTVPACMEDYVITRHCKTEQQVVYFKTYKIGESLISNAAAVVPCP